MTEPSAPRVPHDDQPNQNQPAAYPGPGPFAPPSASYGPYPPRHPQGAPHRTTSTWLWVGLGVCVVAGVVLLIVTVVVVPALVMGPIVEGAGGGQNRADAVTTATSGLTTSPGLVYRGRVKSYSGQPMDAAVTVDHDGTMRGEVTRATGGHAEFAMLGDESMVRGDADWYRGDSPENVAKVADQWVRDPYGNGSVTTVKPLFPSPEELKNKLTRYSSAYSWSGESRQQINGASARVITGSSNDVAIDDSGTPPQLVSWTNHASDVDNTLSVAAATPSDLALIAEVPTLQASTPTYSTRVVSG